MITKEHLEHWIRELQHPLSGILNEVAADKTQIGGINLPNGKYVSFEYILEKVVSATRTIGCIEFDILKDGTSAQDDLKAELDNIDKDLLIEYILENWFDEVKEAIQEASRP